MSRNPHVRSVPLRTYRDATDLLESLVRTPPRTREERERLGLSPIESLLARIGNPHRKLAAIHITGSKGKGSTALYTEALLAGSGAPHGHLHLPSSRGLERAHPGRRLADRAFAAGRGAGAGQARHRGAAPRRCGFRPRVLRRAGRRRLLRLCRRVRGHRGDRSGNRSAARSDPGMPSGGHLRHRRRAGAHRAARTHHRGHRTRESGDRASRHSTRHRVDARGGAGSAGARSRACRRSAAASGSRIHDPPRRRVAADGSRAERFRTTRSHLDRCRVHPSRAKRSWPSTGARTYRGSISGWRD